jgi:hypothetical protein
MFRQSTLGFLLLNAVLAWGCGSGDPTGSGGEGTLVFTTWGEEYIEHEIPEAEFADGWSVEYEKFLVNFQNIVVAGGEDVAARGLSHSLLFDNHVRGVKSVVDFDGVAAKAYANVSYAIAPVSESTALAPGVTENDKQLMLDRGYSIYVEGKASKGDLTKRFAWGFAIGTRYQDCHSQQDGRDEAGVVVTNRGELEVQLTTHGDHLFYDRLQASTNPSLETALRFDALAEADDDDDGEVTMAELNARPLNVRLYDPSGLEAATQGAFVTALARTVGHFRGEGECTIARIE